MTTFAPYAKLTNESEHLKIALAVELFCVDDE